VTRSVFDQMLLDNALQAGAQVMMETTARELLRDENGAVAGVRAQNADGTTTDLYAPMVADASGRDMFAINRHDWKVPDPELKKIAIWTYYKGAKRDPGIDEGATTVAYVPENGWFWYIPQEHDMVSVGVVAERDYLYRGPRDPDAIFQREVDGQPWIKDHVSTGTKMGPCKVTGDYSYRSRYSATDGLVLVGDAFAFLDPVFSSGVFLALHSGVAAGDAIDAALEAGDYSAARFMEYGEQMCQAVEAMRRLVYAFYDTSFSFRELFKKYPELRPDVTDCLIGNLYKDFDALWRAMSEFADLPEPLKHGRAMVRAEEVGPRA
jgi:flavin-dependent dehydrogenase